MNFTTLFSTLIVSSILFSSNAHVSADLVLRDIKSTGTIDSLADADALIAGTGIESETTTTASFIDLRDSDGNGGSGNFGNNFSFPNDTPGVDDNDFVLHATGQIFIPSGGAWTFGINSDDGARLRIGGVDVIVDDNTHGTRDFLATTTLTSGWHSLDFVFFERGGAASVELFAAQGSFTSFAGNNFQLVGDAANSGLLAAVPEPGAATVITLMMLGMFQRRSRLP